MSVRPYGDSPVLSAARAPIRFLPTEAQLKRIHAMQLSFDYVKDEDSLNLLIEEIRCFLNDNFPDVFQRDLIEETYFKGRLTKS